MAPIKNVMALVLTLVGLILSIIANLYNHLILKLLIRLLALIHGWLKIPIKIVSLGGLPFTLVFEVLMYLSNGCYYLVTRLTVKKL